MINGFLKRGLTAIGIAKQRPKAVRKRPATYVSLNKWVEIVMNELAFKRIDEPANVTLLYNPKLGLVGVK